MTGKKVITVTLNPSLDRTMVVHYLAVGYHNPVTDTTRLDPAGRGVNIARALHHLGVPTHSIIVLGDDATGAAYQTLIARQGLPATFVLRRGGVTRSNVTILDTGNHTETTLVEKAPTLTAEHVQAVAEALGEQVRPGDFVVFAGSLPEGAPADLYARLLRRAAEAGGITVLSVTTEAMAAGIEALPGLLVVNQTELESYFNHPVRTDEDVEYCQRKLREKGIARVLAILEGGRARLQAPEGDWRLEYAEDTLGTQSGVKEAVLAGFLAGWLNGLPLEKALELGGAAAVYTSGQIGSAFGSPDEVAEHTSEVDVTPGNGG